MLEQTKKFLRCGVDVHMIVSLGYIKMEHKLGQLQAGKGTLQILHLELGGVEVLVQVLQISN